MAADVQTEVPPRLAYPVVEVATLLSVSPGLIYKEIKAGRLKSSRVGSITRVTLSAIQEYLNEQQRIETAVRSRRSASGRQ